MLQEQIIEALSDEVKELHGKLNEMGRLLKFAVDRQYYFNAFYDPELKKLDDIPDHGILLCGNYGNPNTGDEWMLETILDYISRYTTKKVTIMLVANRKFDPSLYLKYDVDYIHCPQTIYDYDLIEKKFDVLIFGGGAIIEDGIYWEAYDYGINICRTVVDLPLRFIRHEKKVLCIGLSTSCGLSNREYIGKLQQVIDRAAFFSVRDPYSLQVIQDAGLCVDKVKLTHDIVYANRELGQAMEMTSEKPCKSEVFHVGIVYIVAEETKVAFCTLLQKLETELQLYQKDYKISIIPFYDDWHIELDFYKKALGNNPNVTILPYNSDIRFMINTFQNQDLLICARYHAILMALTLGIPCVPLYYDTHQHYPNKIKHLLGDFGFRLDECIPMSKLGKNDVTFIAHALKPENNYISRKLMESARQGIEKTFEKEL